MRTKNIIKYGMLVVAVIISACEPNKELYEQLDELQQPYNKAIEYTLSSADYNSVGGAVRTHQAFNDTAEAKDYVPEMLARKYVALNLRSSAMVTFNHLIEKDRPWEKVVFGYTLTTADYQAIGGSVATYQNFWATNPAKNHLPNYLLTLYPAATTGQTRVIIYNFYYALNQILPYADTYEFDGTSWIYIDTITDMAEADYILTDDDYAEMGFSTPLFPANSLAERNLPIWLKQHLPYAYSGNVIILQYTYGTIASPTNVAVQYEFDGNEWTKSTGREIETRSEQYVFAISGWIFDPTIRFIMSKADYGIVAYNDPIPHPRFADQGYYYGASAYYGNFDMRLLTFHLRVYTWNDLVYDPAVDDPNLVEIYENDGPDAATAELFRRIVQEGLIALLQEKFPDAEPQVGGVDVHYVVGFETYNDNLSRSYLEAEYKCTAAATSDNPPQFEFVDGPRDRN